MSTFPVTCECLLLDASTVISLYASRRMPAILKSMPAKIAIVGMTRQHEIKYIWGGPDDDVRQCKEVIDLQSFIDYNQIIEVELDDTESTTMVNLAARRLGNGESAATAVAVHRGWAVCTEDFKDMRRLQSVVPSVSFVITSQLVYHWATVTGVSEIDVRTVIQSMHLRAGFGRSQHDILADWVQNYL